MAPAAEARPLSVATRPQLGATRNARAGCPTLPAVRRRRPARETLAGPTCAAAVDVGGAWAAATGAAPARHDGPLEEAAGARQPKNQAAPLVRLGALVSAAASALVPLLHVRLLRFDRPLLAGWLLVVGFGLVGSMLSLCSV